MVLKIEIKGNIEDEQYNGTDWTKIKELKEVQDKYDLFLMIYEGVKEYVPFYKGKEKRKKKWFN